MENRKNSLLEILLNTSDFLILKNYNFALIGGLAYSVIYEPRATYDLDFIIEIKNFDKFLKDLRGNSDFIFVHDKPMIFENAEIERVVHKDNIVIDFLIADDDYKRNVLKRKKELIVNQKRIFIVAVEDLIILKLLSRRDIDIVDVKNLLKLKDLDNDYIDYWIDKLKLIKPT